MFNSKKSHLQLVTLINTGFFLSGKSINGLDMIINQALVDKTLEINP